MVVHRAAGPAQGHVGTYDCRIRRSCVSDAWHGMWVVGMSHEVCAVVQTQCLIAVVGNAGLYTGFWDCTAMCEAVAVSFRVMPYVRVEMCACVVHTFGSWGCCMLCVLPWACDVLVAVVGHAWLYTELQGLHRAMWGGGQAMCRS